MNNSFNNDDHMESPIFQQLWEAFSQQLQQGSIPSPIDSFKAPLSAALQTAISNMGVVTQEEFLAQQAVLLRTRERLESLEKTVSELEQQVDPQS